MPRGLQLEAGRGGVPNAVPAVVGVTVGMKVSVAILEQRIRATSQWRNNLIAKRDASDGTDKSIDDLIADADAYIQSLQLKIEAINRSAKG